MNALKALAIVCFTICMTSCDYAKKLEELEEKLNVKIQSEAHYEKELDAHDERIKSLADEIQTLCEDIDDSEIADEIKEKAEQMRNDDLYLVEFQDMMAETETILEELQSIIYDD